MSRPRAVAVTITIVALAAACAAIAQAVVDPGTDSRALPPEAVRREVE